MLRVELRDAKPGMVLALPIQNPKAPARVLLRVGYELTPEIVDKLREVGIRSIWVRYPSLAFLEKFIDAEKVQTQSAVVGQIADTFQTLQQQASAKLPYETYTKSIGQLVDYIVSHPQSAMFLGDIADASDDDLLRHSSAVTYLAVLMGLKLEGYLVRERRHVDPARAKEVSNLGLGAMLHDVGTSQLDPEVRERYKQTGNENDPQWQEHTALGYRMVRGKIDPSAAAVVLHHHQRYDGSGHAGKDFPVLREKNIHVFARIVAVADHFDCIRSPANLPQQPTVWVLNSMLTEPLASKFDVQVLATLLAVVPPYPPGSIVRLSDGRHAVCIDHNIPNPCRPVVQIIPDPKTLSGEDLPSGPQVDLAGESPRLFVAQWDGQDVGELNFQPPSCIADHSTAPAWL
jgi:HD-GYP domain-containing protein (c-di-GMP phosphodiesterase class II)